MTPARIKALSNAAGGAAALGKLLKPPVGERAVRYWLAEGSNPHPARIKELRSLEKKLLKRQRKGEG